MNGIELGIVFNKSYINNNTSLQTSDASTKIRKLVLSFIESAEKEVTLQALGNKGSYLIIKIVQA